MNSPAKPFLFKFDTFMRSVDFEYLKPVNLWTGVEHSIFVFTDVPNQLRVEVYDHDEQWTIKKTFTCPVPTTLREADAFHASCFTFYDDPSFNEDGEYDAEKLFKGIERDYRRLYRLEEQARKRQKTSKLKVDSNG